MKKDDNRLKAAAFVFAVKGAADVYRVPAYTMTEDALLLQPASREQADATLIALLQGGVLHEGPKLGVVPRTVDRYDHEPVWVQMGASMTEQYPLAVVVGRKTVLDHQNLSLGKDFDVGYFTVGNARGETIKRELKIAASAIDVQPLENALINSKTAEAALLALADATAPAHDISALRTAFSDLKAVKPLLPGEDMKAFVENIESLQLKTKAAIESSGLSQVLDTQEINAAVSRATGFKPAVM